MIASARSICCYVALPDEVETRPLIAALWARRVRVSVPTIVAMGQMVAVPIKSWDELAPGRFGILEPRLRTSIEDVFDVVIVPGQAFTLRGDRQGRGYGYYDRFLEIHPTAVRVALAAEATLVAHLSTRAHDEPVDWIVTEQRLIETRARTRNIPR